MAIRLIASDMPRHVGEMPGAGRPFAQPLPLDARQTHRVQLTADHRAQVEAAPRSEHHPAEPKWVTRLGAELGATLAMQASMRTGWRFLAILTAG
jgi:hypothetical protein